MIYINTQARKIKEYSKYDIFESLMNASLTRHALFARLRGGQTQIRPPWSRQGTAFTDNCTLCGKCAAACPAGIIVKGHAGYPIVSFAEGGCTFCGACAEACQEDCFDRTAAPWDLKAAISDACVEARGVSCRMCEEACPSAAIAFRPRLGGGATASVRLTDCSGCGTCAARCPVNAISLAAPVQTEVTA